MPPAIAPEPVRALATNGTGVALRVKVVVGVACELTAEERHLVMDTDIEHDIDTVILEVLASE